MSIEKHRLEGGKNVKHCHKKIKNIGVSDERALSSFLEDGVNVFLKILDTSYHDYTLL